MEDVFAVLAPRGLDFQPHRVASRQSVTCRRRDDRNLSVGRFVEGERGDAHAIGLQLCENGLQLCAVRGAECNGEVAVWKISERDAIQLFRVSIAL